MDAYPNDVDPTENNRPAILGRIDSAEGNTFGQPQQSVANTAQNRLIGSLTHPFDAMKTNWNAMTDSYKNGNYGLGALQTVAMAKNPMGSWGSTPQQQATQQQAPAFQPHHFGPADSNGITPFSQEGKSYINRSAGINDNSSLVDKFHQGGIPNAPFADMHRGLGGNLVHKFVGLLSSQDSNKSAVSNQQTGADNKQDTSSTDKMDNEDSE